LRQEIEATTAQLEDDVRTGVEQTRWVSLGAWGILLLSIVGVSRWVLAAGLRRIERDREELAEAERAVLDAADGERVRLGQELHDGLCQQLGGLRLLALATQRAASDQTTRDSLESLESLAARALDMARALSHGLYPGDVRAVNLAGALERLGTEVAELGSFHFTFDGPESTPSGVTDGEAMQLYRIAQEAISNAVRHGNPRSLKIGLQAEPLTLSVEDDGIGLSSTSDGSTTAGVGLSSMHARARAVNARIKFFSTPQEGTRVVVTRSETPLDSQALDEIPVTPLTDCTTS
jgi:signal transduction histidine kinase